MQGRWVFITVLGLTVNMQASRAADPKAVRQLDNYGQFQTCPNCDLQGANLKDRFLRLANLPGVNLAGANLSGADLTSAILWDAKLGNANFTFANLSGTMMERADASGANFSNAWMVFTLAKNVRFGRANFTGARIRGLQVHGADLSEAIGLDRQDLKRACGDAETKLPPGYEIGFCVE